jgi:Tfp pilus assembly protein PilF
MDKNIVAISAAVVLLSAAVIAVGQSHQQTGQSPEPLIQSFTDMTKVHLTPAQMARIDEIRSLDKAAAAALDADDYAEAEADARKVISLGPDSGVAQEVLASALYAQGKTQEALQAYKVMADEHTDDPRNLLPYAMLLLKTRHWKQAVAEYNEAVPNVSDPFPRNYFKDLSGESLLQADSHFSPGVPQPQDLATAIHVALGLTYGDGVSWGRHSQDDRALIEFQKALALEPDSPLANLFYAKKLQSMRRSADAQAYFKKAAALGQEDMKAAAEKEMR